MTSESRRTTTAQSRELGAELRAIRVSAGLGAAEMAAELGWSPGKVSKLEQGWRGASAWDIGALLGRCGADRPTRDRVMVLAGEQHAGWFVRPHSSVVLHERSALTISCYEPMAVPVLLQTEDYARASSTGVDRLAERQAVLHGDRAPDSVFYVREEALRRQVGGPSTMRDQLMGLVFLSWWPHVTVRLVPSSAGTPAELDHGSTVLTYGQGAGPLVHTSTDLVTVFLDDERVVRAHEAKHAVLARLAWDEDRSREAFARLADAFDL
ncbi:helix-turn-helix domain-containing protein [Umezawaea tangerina]|uniref:helix-turn-helix domain-containing protein n=1 Tax=Umezawaea tangerina TaxID=84725 RepID=UPI001472D51C|nr:helix-turn-helix transcriptional regulator [Umezawaea tangerina]